MKQQLLLVYNAHGGLFNSLNDFAHKIISPSTYQCSLCALTYGNFSMKEEWKNFIQQLPVTSTFLHKNEFEKAYKLNYQLPAIFLKTGDEVLPLISNKEMDNCQTLQQLKHLVSSKLSQHAQHHHSNL